MTDWEEAKARLEEDIANLPAISEHAADIRAALEEVEKRDLKYPDDLGIQRDAAGLSVRCGELRDRLVAQGKRAEAAEAEVERLKGYMRPDQIEEAETIKSLVAEVARLRAGLSEVYGLALQGRPKALTYEHDLLFEIRVNARAALRGER